MNAHSSTTARPHPQEIVGTQQERRITVWLLTNAPSPYQAELLSAIARREDLSLDVRYMRGESRSGQATQSAVPAVVMSAAAPTSWRDEFRLHPQALLEATFGRHDCYVLSGLYTSMTFLCCAALLTAGRKPWIAWLERPHPDRLPEGGWQPSLLRWAPARRLRRFVQRQLLRRATRVLCIGTAAREAYAQLGAAPEKLDVLPYCCDVHRFESVSAAEIEALRQRYALVGQTVFLFSGQMIRRKGVDTLLSAFEQVAEQTQRVSLLLLGDGPQRSELEQSVAAGCRDRVHFLGHVPQSELPALYRAADVFVFPSRHDGWGVVINEACAAELPILTTRQTGAARDLVVHGENGFVYERDDICGFADGLRYFLQNPEALATFGRRSRELVECWSPVEGAAVFAASVQRAVHRA